MTKSMLFLNFNDTDVRVILGNDQCRSAFHSCQMPLLVLRPAGASVRLFPKQRWQWRRLSRRRVFTQRATTPPPKNVHSGVLGGQGLSGFFIRRFFWHDGICGIASFLSFRQISGLSFAKILEFSENFQKFHWKCWFLGRILCFLLEICPKIAGFLSFPRKNLEF